MFCVLRWFAPISLLLALAGCASSPPPSLLVSSAGPPTLLQIQAQVMDYADEYATAMADVCDWLELRARTDEGRRFARERKYGSSLGAFNIAVEPNPVASLANMTVMVTLMRMTCEDKRVAAWFGDDAARLIAVASGLERDMWLLASKWFSEDDLKELRKAIEQWRSAHPEQFQVSHVRLLDLPKPTNQAPDKRGPSIFSVLMIDPFAGLDPAARELQSSRLLGERVFFYMQRMPTLMLIGVHASYSRMLEAPSLEQLMGDMTSVSRSADRATTATTRMAAEIDKLPLQLATERQAAIEQLAAAFRTEQQVLVAGLSRAVSSQREALLAEATTRTSAQVDSAIRQVTEAAAAERAATVSDVERAARQTVDLITVRLLLLVPGCVLGGALALFLVRRVIYGRRPVQ